MKNMRVTAKLFTSFSALLILAIIIGTVGIYGMSSISNADSALYNDNVIAISAMGGLRETLQRQRIMSRNFVIYSGNAAKTQETHNTMRELEAKMDELFVIYEGAITDMSAEKAYYDAKNLYQNEYATIKENIQLGSAQSFEAGMAALDDPAVVSTTSAMVDGFTTSMENNDLWAKVTIDDNAGLYQSMSLISIIALVLTVTTSAFLAIYISLLISKPLRKLSAVARMLAAGDTSVEFESIERKDEIGELSKSFDSVIQALRGLNQDASMLVDAANQGQLSARADASKHQGDYRKIIEGVNETLEAVVTPVQVATDVLSEMSKGNLGVSVKGDFKGDHALIQNALNNTIENIRSYIDQIKEALAAMASGDFNTSITSDFKGDFVELKKAINAIADSLSGVMSDINMAAEQVAAGTQQVSDGSQSVSQGATQQASSIEELTATITGIAEQVKQTSQNVNETNQTAVKMREYAIEGSEQMRNMQQAMDDINISSENISKIIKVIDDIAFQTNILALNAAVEAARAGVHGKGFAVVAVEVGDLAAKSADAAKETTDLIEGSIKKAEIGTRIANDTAKSLKKIVESVEKSVDALDHIASASSEQAMGVAQVNIGIEQMSQVVQTNSATAEQTAAATEELSSQADILKQLVGKFKLKGQSISNVSKQPVQKSAATNSQKRNRDKEDTIILSNHEFGKY